MPAMLGQGQGQGSLGTDAGEVWRGTRDPSVCAGSETFTFWAPVPSLREEGWPRIVGTAPPRSNPMLLEKGSCGQFNPGSEALQAVLEVPLICMSQQKL